MSYHITVTRVLSLTYWQVTCDGKLVSEKRLMRTKLSDAKAQAKTAVPDGAEYTVTLDTPCGQFDSGPFIKGRP